MRCVFNALTSYEVEVNLIYNLINTVTRPMFGRDLLLAVAKGY